MSAHFWVWNQIKAVKAVTRHLNRLSFAFGMALWKLAYRMKGKRVPKDLRLSFSGSLAFRAVKG